MFENCETYQIGDIIVEDNIKYQYVYPYWFARVTPIDACSCYCYECEDWTNFREHGDYFYCEKCEKETHDADDG